MGLDIFAKIAGTPEESLDAAYKDKIDVLSFSWGVTHPVSAPAQHTGRIIHSVSWLLLSEAVVADLTNSNAIDLERIRV